MQRTSLQYEEIVDIIDNVQQEIYDKAADISSMSIHLTTCDIVMLSRIICDNLKGSIMNYLIQTEK